MKRYGSAGEIVVIQVPPSCPVRARRASQVTLRPAGSERQGLFLRANTFCSIGGHEAQIGAGELAGRGLAWFADEIGHATADL